MTGGRATHVSWRSRREARRRAQFKREQRRFRRDELRFGLSV